MNNYVQQKRIQKLMPEIISKCRLRIFCTPSYQNCPRQPQNYTFYDSRRIITNMGKSVISALDNNRLLSLSAFSSPNTCEAYEAGHCGKWCSDDIIGMNFLFENVIDVQMPANQSQTK